MEIEVGEYVRTKNGEIHKIIEINNPNDELWTYYKFENNMGDYKEKIVKHSKNIIDLVEVGDYVNGFYIDELPRNPDYKILWHTSKYGDDDQAFEEKDIKSIVTHEMFESIEYKVEEDK